MCVMKLQSDRWAECSGCICQLY